MKNNKEIKVSDLFDDILNQTPKEDQLFVSKSLEIANQIITILENNNMQQKDLAKALGKTEAEISRWLNGFHNFTIKTIAKIEACLHEDIIKTPMQMERELMNLLESPHFISFLNQTIIDFSELSMNSKIKSDINTFSRIQVDITTDIMKFNQGSEIRYSSSMNAEEYIPQMVA